MKRNLLLLIIPILLFYSCAGTKKIAGVYQGIADGTSYKNAIIIQEKSEKAGINAEYAWIKLKYPNSSTRGQTLNYYEKKPFDIIKIITTDGRNIDVYFDISNFYGKF